MPKYLLQGSYSAEGAGGILKLGGSQRREAVEQAARSLGGNLEAFYFAFGEPDAFAVIDMPDCVSAAAISLVINTSGTIRCKTTVLMTPEEIDEAARKTVSYRAPGR